MPGTAKEKSESGIYHILQALFWKEEYNSHNTERFNIEQIKEKLPALDYVQNELKGWNK